MCIILSLGGLELRSVSEHETPVPYSLCVSCGHVSLSNNSLCGILQIADYVIDPMCRGIFAGSAHNLSMRSAFPVIHQYEASYGTVVGGALMTKPGVCVCVCERERERERGGRVPSCQAVSELTGGHRSL